MRVVVYGGIRVFGGRCELVEFRQDYGGTKNFIVFDGISMIRCSTVVTTGSGRTRR